MLFYLLTHILFLHQNYFFTTSELGRTVVRASVSGRLFLLDDDDDDDSMGDPEYDPDSGNDDSRLGRYFNSRISLSTCQPKDNRQKQRESHILSSCQ